MKKVLTAIGNPMLNNKISKMQDYNVLTNDISNDEELIEWLAREKQIDVLFLCSNIIKHYKIDEFITIIRKLNKNIIIYFFKVEGIQSSIKEDDKLKIYTSLELDLNIFKEILERETNENIEKNKSKIIAISGANGVRQKYVFHISCKKCGKCKHKNVINRF